MIDIGDLELEMEVLAKNCFGQTYFITAIDVEAKKLTLTCRTGDKIMRGGKWIDEEFHYTNQPLSVIKKIVSK